MRRASLEEIEDLAEAWGVEPEDVRELAREWHVPILELEAEAQRRVDVEHSRELRAEDADEGEDDDGEPLDDSTVEEYAELWGVSPEEVEALSEELDLTPDEMSKDELRDYIDDLYDALTGEGWDLDVSDLWDMYYGYAPGGDS